MSHNIIYNSGGRKMDKQKENKISNICSGGGVEFYREKMTKVKICMENLDN